MGKRSLSFLSSAVTYSFIGRRRRRWKRDLTLIPTAGRRQGGSKRLISWSSTRIECTWSYGITR
eukprot:scaffold890_cov269-Pinguiococcus_pyrenoidosus.AAC.6